MPPFHMFSSAPSASSYPAFPIKVDPVEEQSIDFDRNPYDDYYTSSTDFDLDDLEPHPSYQLTQELFSGSSTVSGSFIKTLPHYFHSLANQTKPSLPVNRSKDDFNLSPEPSRLQRDFDMQQDRCDRVDYLQFPFQSHIELLMPTWSAVVAQRVPRPIGDLMREAVFDFEEGELMPGLDYEGNQKRLENVLWRVWARSQCGMMSEVEAAKWDSKRKAAWRQGCEASDLAFDMSSRDRHPRARPCFEPWLYGPVIGLTQCSSQGSPLSTRLETPGSLKSCLKLPSVHISAEVELLGNMLGEHVDDCSSTDLEHESSTDEDSDNEKENTRPALLRTTSLPPVPRRSSVHSAKSPILSRILEASEPLLGRVAAVAQCKIASKRKHRTRSESPTRCRRIEFNNVVDRRVIVDPDGSTTEAEAEGGSSGNEESSEDESNDEDRALANHLRAARLRAGKKIHDHRRSASAPSPRSRTPPKRRPRSLTAPIEPGMLAPAHEVRQAPKKAFFDPSWMPEEVAAADVLIYGDGADSSSDEEAGFDWGSQRIAMRRGGSAKRRATWAPSMTTGRQRRQGGVPKASSLPLPLSPREIPIGLPRSASSSSSLSSLSSGLGLRISSSNLQQLKYQKQATNEALVHRPAASSTISFPKLQLIREHPLQPLPVIQPRSKAAASSKGEEAWIEHRAQVTEDDDVLGPGYWNATPTPSPSPAPQHLFHRKVDCSDILPKTISPKPTRWSGGISSISALRSILDRSKPTTSRTSPMPSAPGPALVPRL